jgi:methionyl-tRNA formyltransferase
LAEKIKIGNEETAGELHDQMKEVGAKLLLRTIQGFADGSFREIPQVANGPLKHAPKIFTETCKIDWNKPVDEVYNMIRGLSPYPTAFTYLDNKMLKIYKAKHHDSPTLPEAIGTFQTDHKTYLHFACSDGYIYITELQLEGKKKMTVEEFLRGYHFN